MESENSTSKKTSFISYITKYKYIIVLILFSVWMLFFDQNSFLMHKELNNEIDKLNEDIEYYQKELDAQNQELKQLENNKSSYEKIAREKYFMKKSNEDIFIIELKDSIQPEEN
ncbi:septum formation initiator family protein [Ornithobacterium rhinotracheale]|uniref:FtsB family cell division protein n=1 Tax=Ornithobacterium rhinotracheale TaxID=28251 RepID=UPI00129C95EB|nr:septum formation initiator family protein [Ornithobacterium rhinotracheale]MRI63378.1 septum formation initiator family protein [Ornithobacterium rhinotracheale]MRJ10547.1 septum formation initiator family protein [Ornithobacterium rhinotracheale]